VSCQRASSTALSGHRELASDQVPSLLWQVQSREGYVLGLVSRSEEMLGEEPRRACWLVVVPSMHPLRKVYCGMDCEPEHRVRLRPALCVPATYEVVGGHMLLLSQERGGFSLGLFQLFEQVLHENVSVCSTLVCTCIVSRMRLYQMINMLDCG
jgi:hypothetical protein